eukprot:TRINITY_DN9474_c0_g2_i1.p1 TRINITY_DN9474_c0_g2~~TRINITY_DN9474_c0_g2_i1.p1  ORF type:complete len:1193 (+),score=214.15 TRINITY_DN9474_c0_g2_i1:41-3580(+)
MRIFYKTAQQCPLDVEPSDSIRDIRNQVADKEGVTANSIFLSFNGADLEDESGLTESGLKPNSVIAVVSLEIAEKKADAVRVRQVQHVFSTLALSAKDDGGEGFEHGAEALRKAPLFPLLCNPFDLSELGPGVPLFLDFIKCTALIMSLVFLAQIAALVEYGTSSGLEKWPAAQRGKGVSPTGMLSPGSLGPEGSTSAIPITCAIASCMCSFTAGFLYVARQTRIAQTIDDKMIHPNDFGLLVSGLPTDIKDESEVRDFFKANAVSGQKVDVVQVVLGYDVPAYAGLIREKQQLAKEAAAASPGSEEAVAVKAKMQEINKKLMSEPAIREAVPFTGKCLVILRSQKQHRLCLKEWDTAWMSVCRALFLLGFESAAHSLNPTPRFRDTHALDVSRAPYPSDLIWPNFGEPISSRRCAMLRTASCMFCLVGVSFGVIIGMRELQKAVPALTILTVFVILCANVAIEIFSRILVMKEKHVTKTDRDVVVMYITSIAMVLNTAVVLVPLYPDPDSWYRDGGLCYTITVLEVMGVVMLPAMIYFNPAGKIKKYRVGRIDLTSPESRPSQAELNKRTEPREMDFAKAYAKVFRSFIFAAIYTPLLPICSFLTALELLALYAAFKYSLLRYSKRPYNQSEVLAESASSLLYGASFGLAVAALFFIPPSLQGDVRSVSYALTVLLAFASVVAASLPRQFWQRCWGRIFELKWRSDPDAESDWDSYYVAQTLWPKELQYHSWQPVYVHMENVYRSLKDRGVAYAHPLPWDTVTGNLRAPEDEDEEDEAEDKAEKGATPGAPEEAGEELEKAAAEVSAKASLKADVADDDPEVTEERDPAEIALSAMKLALPEEAPTASGRMRVSTSMEAIASLSKDELSYRIEAGSAMIIIGLSHAPQWNGTRCKVLTWNDALSKWHVKLSSGAIARLAAENLAPTKLVLTNIVKQPELNDTEVDVIGWDESLKKWIVKLPTGAKARLALENVRHVDPAKGDAKPAPADEQAAAGKRRASSRKVPKKKPSRRSMAEESQAPAATAAEPPAGSAGEEKWPARENSEPVSIVVHDSEPDAAEEEEEELRPGRCIAAGAALVIVALVAKPEFNGKSCTAVEWDEEAGKWHVELASGGHARLAAENLAKPEVRVKRCPEKPELDGSIAAVTNWDESANEWLLLASATGEEVFRLPPANVGVP